MPRVVVAGVAFAVVFGAALGLGALSSGETATKQATEFDVPSSAPDVSNLQPGGAVPALRPASRPSTAGSPSKPSVQPAPAPQPTPQPSQPAAPSPPSSGGGGSDGGSGGGGAGGGGSAG